MNAAAENGSVTEMVTDIRTEAKSETGSYATDAKPRLEDAAVLGEDASLLFAEDPDIVLDFVLEATEHLTAIEEHILVLERDPGEIERVHAVFRGFHSIKGLAGFLELWNIKAVSHEMETLLDHARNLRIEVTAEFADLVLETTEYLKGEIALLSARLAGSALPEKVDPRALLSRLALYNKPTETLPDAAVPRKLPPMTTALVAPARLEPSGPTVRQSRRSEAASSTIRVETAKLDLLMDMVGELVIAQSMLTAAAHDRTQTDRTQTDRTQADRTQAGRTAQLARITNEVQRCAMSMRMTSIGPLFQKNAKVIRDLSRRAGKQVALTLSGESTELDKTIAEELADPLLHMVRNAVDHGIEMPEERVRVGKPAEAQLRLRAEHQGGQIVISISDDGRGLNPERIVQKAIERGLVAPGISLADADAYQLIFAPGFSTAEKITDLSGRGVGMDVVRKHVETLRGRVEIESERGRGTTFLIYLPLTLAIIEGLVVLVGPQRYILPLFSVREIFRASEETLFTVQGRDEMILVRDRLLPIVRLHQRFRSQPRTTRLAEGLLVVCQFPGRSFCLFVDGLIGRQEVVVKSLDPAFGSVEGLTGSAILGDGRVGLILDVAGVFRGVRSASAQALGASV